MSTENRPAVGTRFSGVTPFPPVKPRGVGIPDRPGWKALRTPVKESCPQVGWRVKNCGGSTGRVERPNPVCAGRACTTSEPHLPPLPAGSRRDPPRSGRQYKIQEDRNYPKIRRGRRTTASSHENPLKRVRRTTSFNPFSRIVAGDLNPRWTCEKKGGLLHLPFKSYPKIATGWGTTAQE